MIPQVLCARIVGYAGSRKHQILKLRLSRGMCVPSSTYWMPSKSRWQILSACRGAVKWCQEIAIDYPERVDKLVLVDSLFDSDEPGLAHLAKIQAPTLILWDEEDAVIPAQWAHILDIAIHDSRLFIFAPEQHDQIRT